MDIGSIYSDYLKQTATSASNLERNLSGTNKESSEDELLDVCKQFEAYFYEQIFKGMEKAMVPKDDSDPNNTMVDYFKENLITEYSKSVVEQSGDNSLAQQLYEQMKRNYGLDKVDSTNEVKTEDEASKEQVETSGEV